jgi:hypothetical protein
LADLFGSLPQRQGTLRLRADILTHLYPHHLGPKHVATLINAFASETDEAVTGTLWSLGRAITGADVGIVLEGMQPFAREPSRQHRRANFEARRFIEGLITRAISENGESLDGGTVWQWVQLRRSFTTASGERKWDEFEEAIARHPRLAHALFEAIIDQTPAGEMWWRMTQQLSEVMPYRLSAQPLQWLTQWVLAGVDSPEKQTMLYSIALGWSYNAENTGPFERLYALADAQPSFTDARNSLLSSIVDEWRREDAEQRARQVTEREEGRRRNSASFEENREAIRRGEHTGWLIWLADVYYAHFNDVDAEIEPRERLVLELGSENTALALEGLKATLTRPDLPSMDEIATAEAENSYHKWWYAILAGMEELWSDGAEFSALTDAQLRTVVALGLVMVLNTRRQGVLRRREQEWKPTLLRARPALFRNVYLALAEAGLRGGRQHVSGLYEILNAEELEPFRGDAALSLLESVPNASVTQLRYLFRAVGLPAEHWRPTASVRSSDASGS